jgi:hypothetical protein
LVKQLTERHPERAGRFYPLLLDYLFWVGASAAQQEVRREELAIPNAASPGR